MKDLSLLHPEARAAAVALVAECAKAGIDIFITQTLRTKAEQDAIYAQGRTKPGKVVSNARYPDSLHCWGIAWDVAVHNDKDHDGKVDPGEVDWSTGIYVKIAAIAKEKLHLVCGADFKSIKDYPHFQLAGFLMDTKAHSLIENRNGKVTRYATPTKFISTWQKGA